MGWVEKISLINFRNYSEKEFFFSKGINLIYGENGIGKTNLLEALLISSIGRSNKTKNLKEAISHDESKFYINVFYEKEEISEKIHINFNGKEKEILHNKTKHKNFSALLGILPSVLYSPSDVNIITGGREHRRKFMDVHLAQADPVYTIHLSRYNKALKHRNALLKTRDLSSIEAWEQQLVISARVIQEKRRKFISELEGVFAEEFSYFHYKMKVPKVTYKPSPANFSEGNFYALCRERDKILGFTTLGPHRDDLIFSLDEEVAKTFSSEGEKRLIVISLKLASYRMMGALIFAMDDYTSYLDKNKQRHLLERLSMLPQVFLTAPQNSEDLSIHSIQLTEEVFSG